MERHIFLKLLVFTSQSLTFSAFWYWVGDIQSVYYVFRAFCRKQLPAASGKAIKQKQLAEKPMKCSAEPFQRVEEVG